MLILFLSTITIYRHLLLKSTKLLMVCFQKLLIRFSKTNNSHYNLRYTSQFSENPVHSIYNGTESSSYFGPKIWEQIPCEIRNRKFLVGFKLEIKKWKPADCPIFSLIIQISCLLIICIHFREKTLPVSSILGHFDVQKRKASEFQNNTLTCSSRVSCLPH